MPQRVEHVAPISECCCTTHGDYVVLAEPDWDAVHGHLHILGPRHAGVAVPVLGLDKDLQIGSGLGGHHTGVRLG